MTTKVKHIANNVVTDSHINLSTIDSGEIAEGSNLYFTDARVDSRLSGGSVGAITHTQGYTQTAGTWQKQGTVGNVTFSSDGNNIAFSRNGPNYIDTPGASASLNIRTGSSYATAATIDSSQNTTFNGDVTITGQLSITGNIDQYNVTDLDVTDKTITLGSGQTEANSGGSGIVIDGSNASILWDESNDTWDLNKPLEVSSYIKANGAYYSTLTSSGGSFLVVTHSGNEQWSFDAKSGSGSTDYVDFGIAGSTRCMTWQEDGNVGIGTTAPTGYRLVVENTSEDLLKLHNSTDGLDSLISFTNPGGTLGRVQGIDNGGLGFDVGNNAGGIISNAMSIDNAGNAYFRGAGHTNLEVRSASLSTKAFIQTVQDSDIRIGSNTNHPVAFYSNSLERMRIDTDGDVGIGVTPATHARLTLGGTTTSYSSSLAFDNNTTGGATFFMLASDNTWSAGGNKFLMGHGSPSSSAVDVTIDADGFVGIGETSPSYPLDVQRSSGHSYIRTRSTASNTRAALLTTGEDSSGNEVKGYFGSVGDANEIEIASLSNHQLKFYVNNTPAKGMTIDTDGDVGIGTGTPSKLLHLSESADGAKLRITRGGVSEWDFSIGNSSTLTGVGSGALEILPQNSGTANELAIGTAGSTTPLVHVKTGGTTFSGTVTASSSSGTNAAYNLGWQNNARALEMRYDASYYMGIETHAQTRDLIVKNVAGDSAGDVRIQTGTSSTIKDRLVVYNSGNVELPIGVKVGDDEVYQDTGDNFYGGVVFETPIYKEYQYYWSGLLDHETNVYVPSYFMSEIVFTQHQTNGGTDINRHFVGKFANNHTHHELETIHDSGGTWSMTTSMTATDHNLIATGVSGSGAHGRLRIVENYGSGSYSKSTLTIRVYFGAISNITHSAT